MQKIAGWERQTGERLIKALGLPDELYDEANTAVNTRNYLAHSFLRDRAPFLGVEGAAEVAAEELAQVNAQLDTYMRDVGVSGLSEAARARRGDRPGGVAGGEDVDRFTAPRAGR